jgi:hypothetical protein
MTTVSNFPLGEQRSTARVRQAPRCLADLRLTSEDLAALTRQGFVAEELRGQRGPLFKLRFRRQGKQRVRYVGQDPDSARQIQQELANLQAGRRQEQELARLNAKARRLLRETKASLTETVEASGHHFHGQALRRRRNSTQH